MSDDAETEPEPEQEPAADEPEAELEAEVDEEITGKPKKQKKEKIAAVDREGYVEADEEDTITLLLTEFLEGKAWTFVVMTATFYALFQVDLCQYFFSYRADKPLAFITFGVFIVFCFETSLNFILKLDYGANDGFRKFSFYFWLDFIGTVSLIPDFLVIFNISQEAPSNLILARIARVARVGARLTRLMKVFRSKGGKSQYANMMLSDDSDKLEESAASTFGEEVSDGISMRVVTLSLTLLIAVPLFLPHLAESKIPALDLMASFEKDALARSFANGGGAITRYQNFEDVQVCSLSLHDSDKKDFVCKDYAQPAGVHGIGYFAKLDAFENYPNTSSAGGGFLSMNFASCFSDHAIRWKCPESCNIGLHKLIDWEDDSAMRPSELVGYNSTDKTIRTRMYLRILNNHDAYMTIVYMLFNIVIFGAATGAFLDQIFELVINPMERICGALQNLAKSMKQLSAGLDDDSDEFEMLSNSILKLTGMLKTSLGDAGASIIAKNIDAADDSINPMIPGTKMNGYFLFCDVRNFGAAMRVLKEDIMIFTNEICGHVHDKVSDHMGMPNKNIGDSWLNVWTQKEEMVYAKSKLDDKKSFADHALLACLEIQEAYKKNATLKDMCAREGFAEEEAFKDGYELSMGFGLHYGWAIEGAVGSKLKVDATYLSPNVNLSARLEAATKQYGVAVLVTEEFYKRLSPNMQDQMYKVDRVLVVGSSWPTIMYAYEDFQDEGNASIHKKTRFAYEHDMALDKYISGDWAEAKKLLQSCLAERPDAKSAKVLIQFMEQFGGSGGAHAPGDWQGHRTLASK